MEAKFDNLDIFFLKYIHPFEPNEGVKLHNLEWGVGFSTINIEKILVAKWFNICVMYTYGIDLE